MKPAMAFCASSSGVRRAASCTTRSLSAGLSSQALPTSATEGPSQIAAIDICGTLGCAHGQFWSDRPAARAADSDKHAPARKMEKRIKILIGLLARNSLLGHRNSPRQLPRRDGVDDFE